MLSATKGFLSHPTRAARPSDNLTVPKALCCQRELVQTGTSSARLHLRFPAQRLGSAETFRMAGSGIATQGARRQEAQTYILWFSSFLQSWVYLLEK